MLIMETGLMMVIDYANRPHSLDGVVVFGVWISWSVWELKTGMFELSWGPQLKRRLCKNQQLFWVDLRPLGGDTEILDALD